MKTFVDVLKESISQSNLLQELSPAYILVSLSVALICGIIIYLIYRMFYRGACYNENFALLLIMTTLVTAFIIMTISSNIVMSLGMVGALSIVRFRSAVKDPLDVGFLFWSIAAGLTAGAGIYVFAFIGTFFVAIVYLLMGLAKGRNGTFLLVIHYSDSAASQVMEILSKKKIKLKNKTKRKDANELTLQLKVKAGDDEGLVDSLLDVEGVNTAILVEFTGE